jgi:hypothetical protein
MLCLGTVTRSLAQVHRTKCCLGEVVAKCAAVLVASRTAAVVDEVCWLAASQEVGAQAAGEGFCDLDNCNDHQEADQAAPQLVNDTCMCGNQQRWSSQD